MKNYNVLFMYVCAWVYVCMHVCMCVCICYPQLRPFMVLQDSILCCAVLFQSLPALTVYSFLKHDRSFLAFVANDDI